MIEAATPDDVAAIVRLETLALGRDAWSEALVTQGVGGELPTVHYLVVRGDAGAVIAYAVASVAGDIAELQRLAVDPAHRRQGHASALLADVRRRAAAEGVERLLLEVREDNIGALAFYAARDFEELDRRARYYRDGGTAVVLGLALP